MVTVISPLTWGIYNEPPSDVPECGFVGELCPPPIQGESSLSPFHTMRYHTVVIVD